MSYQLAIIGGGPAGAGAGVYAARKKLNTVLITEEIGGQSAVSTKVENWIGSVSLSGAEFAENLKQHVLAYADHSLTVRTGNKVETVKKNAAGQFELFLTNQEKIEADTVLYAAGARRKKLQIPGAEEFENKGIVYCASCDAPMFGGLPVAVIGGGNAGFESAAQLLEYASSVTLLEYNDQFNAEAVTIDSVMSHSHMKALKNVEPLAVKGDNFVTGLTYRDRRSEKIFELEVKGIFVEIGLLPNTDPIAELVKLNSIGQVVTDPGNQRTSQTGLWAAGDCTDGLYHQNNIACGDAVKALEDIYLYLKTSR